MPNRLTKQVRATYIPAVPEVVGRPAYCVSERVDAPRTRDTNVGFSSSTPSSNTDNAVYYSNVSNLSALALSQLNAFFASTNISGVGLGNILPPPPPVGSATTTVSSGTRVTCYPQIVGSPGREAELTVDNLPGWNAGAKSRASAPADLQASFSIPATNAGSLVGLAPVAALPAYNAVTHGLRTTRGTVRVVESGVEKADSGVSPNSATELRITRVGQTVTYHVDSWTYTSLVSSVGAVTLDALLYLGGDYVENPSLSALNTMQVRSTWLWLDVDAIGALVADSAWGWAGSSTINDGRATVTIPLLSLSSDEPYGACVFDPGAVDVESAAGFIEVESAGVGVTLPLLVVGGASAVITGGVEFDIGLIGYASEEDYGYATVYPAPVEVLGIEFDEAPNTTTTSELQYVYDAYTTDPVLYAFYQDGLQAGDLVEAFIAIDAALAEYLVLEDDATAIMAIDAVISAGLRFSDDASYVRQKALQYATNLATGAVTRYEGYDFLGFAKTTLTTYGWSPSGLYRIGGDTDDGQLISAVIDFAATDFNTAQRKRLDAVFFGVDTDGQMFMKLTDDNDFEYTYRVVPRSTEARAVPGRGLSSRFWRLQLQVVDASRLALDHVEWVAGATGRRMTR